MFALRTKTVPHPSKPGSRVLDATPALRGDNVLHTTSVDTRYANVLDRVVAEAVANGEITEEQSRKGLWGAYKADGGNLFLCVCATDGSGVVVGTSVPRGSWRMKQ